jgi:hypothetical protein
MKPNIPIGMGEVRDGLDARMASLLALEKQPSSGAADRNFILRGGQHRMLAARDTAHPGDLRQAIKDPRPGHCYLYFLTIVVFVVTIRTPIRPLLEATRPPLRFPGKRGPARRFIFIISCFSSRLVLYPASIIS